MDLLLLNALKGLKKKKVQMFGIIMMITLSTGIYVAMNTALDRLEDRYYNYLDEQNVENIAFDVNIDYTKDITIETLDYLEENYLTNITEEENNIVTTYRYLLQANQNIDQNIITYLSYILQKYDALNYIEINKIDKLTEEYNFYYEYEKSKTIMEEENLIKVIPYNKDKKINKTYLIEGNYPSNSSEITMLPAYAKKNNIKINDTYKIGDKEYKVVGFTYAPDYVYPLISFSTPIFDEEKNNIIFMTEEDYKEINGIIDNTYAARFNSKEVSRKFEISFNMAEEPAKDDMSRLFDEQSDTVSLGVTSITRIGRIGALQLEFASDRLFAQYFLYLLLAVAVIIIVIITKKRIDDERLQIGVLKSLGYNRFKIAVSYLIYPIIGSIIGGLIGFTIGTILHKPLSEMFLSFYTVPLENFVINFNYLKTSIFLPMIVLSILSYLIALFMLRKKPLELLKEGSNLKVNIFSKIINKITSFFPFELRFKYSLAFRSIGKLLIVAITSFGAGMLIVLTLIGANLFTDMIDKSFEGINYDYLLYMNNTYEGNPNEEEDYVLSVSTELKELKDSNDSTKEIKEENKDLSITLTGIDLSSKYIELLDENNNNIIDKIKDNNVIITANMKKYLNLEIGDKIILTNNNKTYEYLISGISEDYFSFAVYTSREALSKELEYNENAYNIIYSNDSKYSKMSNLSQEELDKIVYIMSFKDLKQNIEKQMQRYSSSIYIVIFFASLMSFIIIAVIANIVVEENKKTISLMKVMGYKNNKISNIVLNIYTPVVVIAYILSIPCMINLLKTIVKALVGDTQITIPITFSLPMALTGLIGLLVAYYIAVSLSKRVLNKIPLAVALKRE